MVAETETQLIVRDEYNRDWKVLPGDPLWEQVKTMHEQGIDPIVLPLALIAARRGWGWWTVFQDSTEWVQNLGVPEPNLETLPQGDNISTGELSELLQKFGAYLTYLETLMGQITSRRSTLKESYDAAMMVATSKLPDGSKLTEKTKEATILQTNETLRQTKRLFIEEDAKLCIIKGLRDAYKICWDTTSRQITLRALEAQITTGRTP